MVPNAIIENTNLMHRCLKLAQLGASTVAPNPMVGAVLVYNNRIIGEGYHEYFGGHHAEVNAIQAVKNELKQYIPNATLYVSLEPCAHFGKTPPCTDLILKNKIKQVVVGCTDPFEAVAGNGIEKLKNNGVFVLMSSLQKQCLFVNRRFVTFVNQKRPYIILKWANTKDGYFAPPNLSKQLISNSLTQRLLHLWRGQEAAILVGTNTAAADNPQLNIRYAEGKNPLRVVIDKNLSLLHELHLFNGKSTTVVFTAQVAAKKLKNVQFITLNFNKNILPQVLNYLHQNNQQSVIVEGGAYTLQQFINHNLFDEVRIFESEDYWNNGLKAPVLPNHIQQIKCTKIADNTLKVYLNSQNQAHLL